MIFEKKFSGRLNSDVAYADMPDGDLLNVENISFVTAQDGQIGALKPVMGNRQVSYTLPAGVKCVGAYEDDENKRLYYLIYDPAGAHKILCYFKQYDYILPVFDSGILEFSGTYITGINKIGNLLFWAEDNRQPKCINVERGLKTFYPAYVTTEVPYDTTTIDLTDITLIKKVPIFPPIATKIITNQPFGQTGQNAFQFAWRYTYRDKQITPLSSYSKLINYNKETENFDCITVTMNAAEKIGYEIDKIDLCVRIRNTGNFSIIKTWTRANSQAFFDQHNSGAQVLTYNFFNDQNGITIAPEESAKIFENIPKYSRALCAAKNRIFLGNNTFGDTLWGSGSVEAKITNVNADPTNGKKVFGTYVMVVTECGSDDPFKPVAINYAFFIRVSNSTDTINGYYDGSSFMNKNDFNAGTLPKYLTLNADLKKYKLSDWPINDDSFIRTEMVLKFPCADEANYFSISTYFGTPSATSDGDVEVSGLTPPITLPDSYIFKSGSRYKTGVIFYDFAGRNMGVYTTDTSVVNVPDRVFSDPSVYPNVSVTLGFSSNQIPSWATSYQIVRTQNLSYLNFAQGAGSDIRYVGKKSDGTYDIGTDTTLFTDKFDEKKVQGIAINISPLTSYGLGYAYNNGDIVKIYFRDGTRTILKILNQVGSYIIAQAKDLGILDLAGKAFIFELSTPKNNFLEDTYYEVGSTYKIINAGQSNRALESSTIIINGDTYVKTRDSQFGKLLFEAMNPLDLRWEDWLTDIGRPSIVLENPGLQVRPTNIVYSNTYISNTAVNGLCRFDSLDSRDLDFKSGAIRALVLTIRTQEYGSIMLAISEIETSSIYLGESRLVDNAGTAIIASSGEVIGTINNLKGANGTIHPESIAAYKGDVYFVDAIAGKVIKYTSNGLTTISENAMSKFFTSILYELGQNNRGLVGVIDKRTGQYRLTVNSSVINPQYLYDYDPPKLSPYQLKDGYTLVYEPQLDGFIGIITYTPEMVKSLGDTILSFKSGQLWVHDVGFNSFFGKSFNSVVSFVLDNANKFDKVVQGVAIEGSTAPIFTHLRNEFPYEQSTDLVDSEYTYMESVYYASFLRDRLTPGYKTREESLLLGEPVRGRYLLLSLTFEPKDFIINSVRISYDESYGHPMMK